MSGFLNIRNKIRQYGSLNILILALKKIASKFGYFHEVYYLYSKKLSSPVPFRKELPADFVVAKLSIGDFEKAKSLDLPKDKLGLYEERLLSGNYLAYGIFLAQTLVYYFWISFCDVELPFPLSDYNTLSVNSDQGYLVDGFCLPEFRGLGLHAYMGVFLMNKLHEMNKQEAITIIKSENRSAIISQERIGFKRVGRIVFYGFGKWKKFEVIYD